MTGIRMNVSGIAPYILNEMDNGTYELPEKTLCAKYFTKQDRVLELGSAVGYVGIATIKEHPGISWISVEANPWCVERSEENYALNGIYPGILPGVAALETGYTKFYVREEFWNSSLDPVELEYSKITDVIECDMYDVNELLEGKTALLMDIEGGEQNLIKSGGINLETIHKLVIEFHSRFTGADYVEYAIDEIERTHKLVERISEVYYFERKNWVRS